MEIVLNDNRTQYETGQQVAGMLRVPIFEEIKADNITIELVGLAEVKWFEILSKSYMVSASVLEDPPQVFHQTKECLHMVNNVPDQDIEKLIKSQSSIAHEIPFQFNLPPSDIPASFRNLDGTIEYKIIGTYKVSPDQVHKVERVIQVLAPIRDYLNVSIVSSIIKDFGVLSLGSGRIIMNACLPRKGYLHGETIDLKLHINNQSSVECTPRAALHQTQVYICGQRHKALNAVLTRPAVGDKVDAHTNSDQTISMAIPTDSPHSIKSDIIVIKYWIHVTLVIPHAFDLNANLPIVVTTESALNTRTHIDIGQ